MGLREIIEEKPAVGYAAAGTILVLALIVLGLNIRSTTSSANSPRWAYDLNTKELFIAYRDQVSPVDTGSGTFSYPDIGEAGAGVDAFVYSCGEPAAVRSGMTSEDLESIDARIGLLLRSPPPNPDQSEQADVRTELVSDVLGQKWVSGQSPPGLKLRSAALAKCPDGKKPWLCVPY